MIQPESFEDHYARPELSGFIKSKRLIAEASYSITEVEKPAGDYSSPALDSLVIVRDLGCARSVVDLGAGRFRPTPGGVTVVPPMSQTQVVVDNRHRLRFLAIPRSKIKAWTEPTGATGPVIDLCGLHARSFSSPLVTALNDTLWEMSEDQSANALVADAALLTLWGALLREAQITVPTAAKGGLAPWQLRRVVDYLGTHLAEGVRMDQLASLVDLSSFHFARAFKHSTGVPPHRYQLALRVSRAKMLLKTTSLPITVIAFEVGYETPQALARLFRRQVGLSPSEYRRQQRS